MASQIGMIGSPAWYDKVFANPAAPDAVAGASPVGTGPFVFESWKPGDTLVVKKNPNYWRQDADGNALPYLDGIEFRVIADELTRANALESGELDLMPTDNGENIKKFRDNGDFTYLEQSERGETGHILLHSGQEGSPLQDQRVRCGLAAAVQQDVIAEVIGQGSFPIANGPFSPGQQGYLEDSGYQKPDPAKAKELIAAYTAENGKPTVKYSTTTDATNLRTAQLIQQWWQDAGVTVEVNQIEQQKIILDALLGDPNFNAFGWRNHGGARVDNQYVWWHSSLAYPVRSAGPQLRPHEGPGHRRRPRRGPRRGRPGGPDRAGRDHQPAVRQGVLADPAVLAGVGHRVQPERPGRAELHLPRRQDAARTGQRLPRAGVVLPDLDQAVARVRT